MPAETINILIAGALLLHGLGHTRAPGALIWLMTIGDNTGSWLPARSWLFPSLAPPAATTVASIFWGLSTIGFIAAAMFF